MEFLFKPRSTGKRQVKPSQDLDLLEAQIVAGESSDDSEFKVGDNDEPRDTSSTSSSTSSSASGSSDSSGDELSQKEVDSLNKDLTTEELLAAAQKKAKEQVSEVKICGCCLGQHSSDANEIVECDGCGISVHEGCYGIVDSAVAIAANAANAANGADCSDGAASEVSAASTEPWFCEPCRAGLTRPPPCELCPVLGGIYKETDAGRWVHLVCALYVPGVAFGDPERMSHVTVFEMNYAAFGRRPCALCEDSRLAHSGVVLGCDAGMCRTHFHAVCAQAHGLLTEPSYYHSGSSQHHHLEDSYLAHCKVHTETSVMKARKRSFMAHYIQSGRRFEAIQKRRQGEHEKTKPEGGENEDERIMRKLAKSQKLYRRERVKKQEPWVPTQKIPRMLTTSASAIRKIQRMGEIKGISVERQRLEEQQALSALEAKKRWHLPPNFSVEYVAYYYDRSARIEELKKNLTEQMKFQSQLRDREATSRPNFELATRKSETATETNEELRKTLNIYRAIFEKLRPDTPLPPCPALRPLFRPIDVIVTPNVKAKATIWASGGNCSKNSNALNSVVTLKTCGICKRTKDQHLLVHCDTCGLHYHLGCLTPPLTRMPKKSKLYGWQCSECDRRSTSSSEEGRGSPSKHASSKPRRRRQAAAKARAATSKNNSEYEEEFWDQVSETPLSNGMKPAPPSAPASVSIKSLPCQDKPDEEDVAKRENLIASAKKEERKRKRKMEKEQRRAERKRKKEEKRRERQREADERAHEGEDEEDEEEENECEIIEKEDGQVIVSIKPKPIKLKIKATIGNHDCDNTRELNGNGGAGGVGVGAGAVSGADGGGRSGPAVCVEEDSSQPPEKKQRRSSTKDIRTHCDSCNKDGANDNLVRCDECCKCFHFWCLVPPVKKSPKVAGYGWQCTECTPSEVDSDWHLD